MPNQLFWNLLLKKLCGEASEDELRELQEILTDHYDLNHQADLIMQMWKQHPDEDGHESESAYLRHLLKHKNEFFSDEHLAVTAEEKKETTEDTGLPRSLYGRKKYYLLSVIVIALITGGFYFFRTRDHRDPLPTEAISSIVTKNGNRTKVLLPDGSQVWLNAGSDLDYNNKEFNKTLREVSLNGEAYFDVVKNKDKPFVIHTKKMDIKVLGTAFNVRSYNEDKIAEATLIRGSIEVTLKDRGQTITLNPNEKITVSNEEPFTKKYENRTLPKKKSAEHIPHFVVNDLKPDPVDNLIGEIAWTQDKLYFDDESLETICPKIERWFGKKVVIETDSLRNAHYRYPGRNETLEEVLSYLKLAKPFNFRIVEDTVIIY